MAFDLSSLPSDQETKFRRHAGQAWPPRLRASPMTSPGEASRDRRLPIGHVPDSSQDGIEEREPT